MILTFCYLFCSLFGLLIVFSFCSIGFIKENFLFLKKTQGRGWFDLFCAGLFLVTADSIWAYIMCSVLVVCGLFFITMGCLDRELGGEDYDPNDLKKEGAKVAVSNASLLS